jgi:hypothetical protein
LGSTFGPSAAYSTSWSREDLFLWATQKSTRFLKSSSSMELLTNRHGRAVPSSRTTRPRFRSSKAAKYMMSLKVLQIKKLIWFRSWSQLTQESELTLDKPSTIPIFNEFRLKNSNSCQEVMKHEGKKLTSFPLFIVTI